MRDWSTLELELLGKRLLEQARLAHQRRVLVLSGEKVWCHQHAQDLIAVTESASVVWVSDIDLPSMEVVAGNKVKTLLGQERDVVVFDAHAGFDPDAFGAVSGIINGGGLLLLLCPPLDAWEALADPAAERIAIWPYEIANISARFIKRLVGILVESKTVTIVRQYHSLPELNGLASEGVGETFADEIFRSQDQQVAVEAIEQMSPASVEATGHRPVVLVSDRGRGKSSALGIAAARLLLATQLPIKIIVTAPRPDAVEAVFAQAQHLLPEALCTSGYLELNHSSIEFHAPDALCIGALDADLVLVDEAAAIPAGMLQQLLQKYSRIVFATTVHGYEGTGRGFAVRFRQILDAQTPGWREVTMHTPIRWADNDSLEQLVFRTLLLDAEAANDERVEFATPANVCIEKLDRDALLADEKTLSQLFGLLVVAHYRTTPNDLRNLLDGPGLAVYVMRINEDVVATALVSAEGGFDPALASEIFEGRRRPRGHLLAQSLQAHIGLRSAAVLKCARIMRIAVHPAVQHRGLGKVLLKYIRQAVKENGADLLGASFGATVELLRFWAQAGMEPVRVGFQRDHASGEHSVMVLAALTESGRAVYGSARERFHRDLPIWLADPLRDLDAPMAEYLLSADSRQGIETKELSRLSEHDLEILHSFAHGLRSYEDSLGPIWRLCLEGLDNPQVSLPAEEKQILNAKVLQRQTWKAVALTCGLSGRAEVLAALRRAVGRLLQR